MEKWLNLEAPNSHWIYTIPYTLFLILLEIGIAWLIGFPSYWWELLHLAMILGFTSLLHFTIAKPLFKQIHDRLGRESIIEHFVLYLLAGILFQGINYYYPLSPINFAAEVGLIFGSIPFIYLFAAIPFMEKRDTLYIHIMSQIIGYRIFVIIYFVSTSFYPYINWNIIYGVVIVIYIIDFVIIVKTQTY